MKIKHTQVKVRDLVKQYTDDTQTGRVSGLDGKLDIRPAYQREFVYKDKQRDAVIETINKGFPLNVIYWAKTGTDTYEVLDGQQRTISICQYCNDEFSLDFRYFHNLTQEEKDAILDYELDVYQCEGTDKEKLDWFKIINIAGEKLTDQELRNAVYTGKWLTDAKRYFSKTGCPASDLGSKYLNGKPIRQDYLEKVLSWKASAEGKAIEQYMAEKIERFRDELISRAEDFGGIKLVRLQGEHNPDMIRGVMPLLRGKFTDVRFAVVGATQFDGKPTIAVFLSQPLVDEGKNAGAMIKAAAKLIQGGGGGQPWMATAGGRDVNGLAAAMEQLLNDLK